MLIIFAIEVWKGGRNKGKKLKEPNFISKESNDGGYNSYSFQI